MFKKLESCRERECRAVSCSSSAPSPRSGLAWGVFCGVSTMLHAQHPTRCHHGKCSAKSSWEKCCSEGLRYNCDSLGARRVSKSGTCICSMCSVCIPKHQAPRTLESLALLGDIVAPKESSRKLPQISFRARISPGWRMHHIFRETMIALSKRISLQILPWKLALPFQTAAAIFTQTPPTPVKLF